MNASHGFARLITLSATAFLAGGMALAQMSPAGQQTPSQPAIPNTAAPGAYPGIGPSQQQDYGAQSFVTRAMQGNDAEIKLAQMAQEKSQSADVKQYAQKLASEHQQMNDKWFKPVAQQLGVSEPKGPSKKDKKEIEKLQALSGSQFDTEYIQMMMKDHQQDLKDFQSEAKSAEDPNIKQIAQQGQTVIAQHLQLAEQLAKSHNVPISGKQVSMP